MPTKEAFLAAQKYETRADSNYTSKKTDDYWKEEPAVEHDLAYCEKLAKDLDKVYGFDDASLTDRGTKKRRRDRDDDGPSKRKKKDNKRDKKDRDQVSRSADRDLDPSAPKGSRSTPKGKGKGKGKKNRDSDEKSPRYGR